jgi:hypothetical protein
MSSSTVPESPSKKIVSGGFVREKLKLSRKQIIAVAVIFGALGAFLIWRSFAAVPPLATIEAETMTLPRGKSISKDRNSSNGQALKFNQNGTATTTVTLQGMATSVTLRTASTKCNNEWASANLAINGKTVLSIPSVSTSNWRDYTKSVSLPKGNYEVKLTASNIAKGESIPRSRQKCDRILWADLISFYGKATTNPVPVVSIGATSPIESGASSTITWSSTGATSCTASDAWSGAKPTSGSANTGALSTKSTYTLTCKGEGGETTKSITVDVKAPSTPTIPTNPPATDGSGNGTLLLDGIFDSNLTNYPTKYFRAGALTFLNARQEKFHVTTADSLAGNEGNYRADILTKDIYRPGVPTCTTVTVQFPNGLATVPRDSWLQFAQAKTPKVDYQGWSMGVSSWYNGGANSFVIGTQGFAGNGKNYGSPVWVSPPMDNGIHNFSICTNNAADNTGMIESIWMDGVRQTFNQGAAKGKQSLGGFPIIKGAAAYPLVINNYTGGSPVPATLIHGAPLISTIGSDGKPPMPPGGWRTF